MHTPTPWAIGSMDDGLWITGPDTKENVICDLVGRNSRYKFTAEDEANAAFIVTACNAHDALVAALQAALPYLKSYAIYTYGGKDYEAALSKVHYALALATPQEAVR